MLSNFTLPSGIRCIHKQSNSPVSHFGILINTGTRDEKNDENGCAHLIEHLLFKGTKTRSSKSISMCMDHIGADINAYTTKEDTCIHVSFLSDYYPRIMNVFSDMLFNPLFPNKEIKKEINVIKEEILSCFDNPSEIIFDDFENNLYAGHSLGRNILGTSDTLDFFCSNIPVIESFYHNNYINNEIIVWSDGNLSSKKFHSLCERYFGNSTLLSCDRVRVRVPQYVQFNSFVDRDDSQCNVIVGGRAFSCFDEHRVAFTLLNHLLGNEGLSSRLNDAVREKRGLAYQIESGYNPYFDTGSFSVFYECEYNCFEKVYDLIIKELHKCCNDKIGSFLLNIAKKQLKGALAVASDSRLNDIISSAKTLSVYDKIESMEETFSKIDAVTSEDLLDVANIVFNDNNISRIVYVPKNEDDE